jgi:predicted dehydrogenase
VVVAPRHVTRHEEFVAAAVGAGAHVYCEKPLARTLEEADRMVAAADAAGVKLACALPWRNETRAGVVAELMRKPAFGELRDMSAVCKCDTRGGGEDFLILGLHFADMMRAFAGPARSCWAHVIVEGRPLQTGDATEGGEGIGLIAGTDIRSHYAFDGGLTGSIVSLRAGITDRSLHPYRIFLHGTRGIISVRAPYADNSVWLYPEPMLRPDGPPWQRTDAPEVREYASYHTPGGADLIEAIEHDRPPACSGADARDALEMILAAYASDLAGTAVALPLADRRHPLA